MSALLSYIRVDSPIHRLNGATKLIIFLVWSLTGMISLDARVLVIMLITGITAFRISRIKFRDIAFVFTFISMFLLLNFITIYLFSPEEGVQIYGTRHVLFSISQRYTVTLEQLFYELTVTLKYYTVVPVALLFVLTTDPSEFASSLNRLGISYKVSYAVALALRYIPDIQTEFKNISHAQQARGIDLSRKAKPWTRLKNMLAILMPLIFSSLDRITVIANAMELRNFGKKKKRTWYSARPFGRNDAGALIFVLLLSAAVIIFTFYDGTRHYNPFL
ncbi:MAG: energy-coupling factor transporter transmembrane protein EcfT [Clostridiaceae bacterium]|nr:energy-coupling factor transporter transmembrane protein EcfT [Clostridiaceae bacterium]